MADEQPSELGGGGTFEVFAEARTSAEPCKGALDGPAPGREWKPWTRGGRSTISIVHGPQWESA
ncbi:hypothetical protein AB7M16_004979 [Bradyrhizobium sp. USDA 372]|nr:hypothetical protein [Bradyrhizobium sp. CCBAU 45321]TWI16323.1 hypothetical protein IQ15_07730 [Bradyrhizobium yuanmingense]